MELPFRRRKSNPEPACDHSPEFAHLLDIARASDLLAAFALVQSGFTPEQQANLLAQTVRELPSKIRLDFILKQFPTPEAMVAARERLLVDLNKPDILQSIAEIGETEQRVDLSVIPPDCDVRFALYKYPLSAPLPTSAELAIGTMPAHDLRVTSRGNSEFELSDRSLYVYPPDVISYIFEPHTIVKLGGFDSKSPTDRVRYGKPLVVFAPERNSFEEINHHGDPGHSRDSLFVGQVSIDNKEIF